MAEAGAVRCFTPLPAAVIYYTVTVHLNTVMQPEVPEHYHCRCDPLTMKLDHSSAQVSVRSQSADLSTHVERYSETTPRCFFHLKTIVSKMVFHNYYVDLQSVLLGLLQKSSPTTDY